MCKAHHDRANAHSYSLVLFMVMCSKFSVSLIVTLRNSSTNSAFILDVSRNGLEEITFSLLQLSCSLAFFRTSIYRENGKIALQFVGRSPD